ncbi:MAG: hypothetical protein M4579_005238 [Chaenotheca gracillima]|nr:MAG: hypothetical protein M4579_005238 [Chaenotheca gracillima]
MARTEEQYQERAINTICAIQLHQTLTLPLDPTSNRPYPIRITYSDVRPNPPSSASTADEPTVLFIPGMMGGRYFGFHAEKAAKKYGVRVLTLDRFGTGGTTMVPLEERMQRWIEIIPPFLDRLGVKHIALASHSVGAVYALNIVLHLRQYLHPKAPYVALTVPWVTPAHSGVALMSAASMLPVSWTGNLHNVIRGVNNNIGPIFNFSSGLYGKITNMSSIPASSPSTSDAADGTGNGTTNGENVGEEQQDEDDERSKSEKKKQSDAISSFVMKCAFAENMEGGSQDALLCLQKNPDPTTTNADNINSSSPQKSLWGTWTDYADVIPVLAAQESQLLPLNPTNNNEGAKKMLIQAFYASSDRMIGKKGGEYVDKCWKEKGDEQFEYESTVVEGADHDSIVSEEIGVLDTILKTAAERFRGED